MNTNRSVDAVLDNQLMPEQKAAAVDLSADILTIACAGSGKSRTLAYRIAYLICSGAAPEGIVAFTFTEKAAESIKRNVAHALTECGVNPSVLGAMYIGTIHGFCQNLLGKIDARYRQFDVLDGNRIKLFLISRYPEIGLKDYRSSRQLRYFQAINGVADAWSTHNEEFLDLDDIEHADVDLGQVLKRVRDSLNQHQYIDFSTMLRRVVDALQEGESEAWESIADVRHLLVDEYQDVNTVQEELIKRLRRNCETVFVVGDDDQSIYGWRGADVGNILNFPVRYPDASTHTLSFNFRSTKQIVTAANELAKAELRPNRLEKQPDAADPKHVHDERSLWFSYRHEEADWIAGRIEALIGAKYVERDGTVRGLTPADFAILMPSTRSAESDGTVRHSAYTDALRQHGIEYTIEAGGSPFDMAPVVAVTGAFALLRNGAPSRDEARTHFDRFVTPNFPAGRFDEFADVMNRWSQAIHGPSASSRRRVYLQNFVHELLASYGIQRQVLDEETLRGLGTVSRMIQDVEQVFVSVDSAQRFNDVLNFIANVAQSGYDISSDQVTSMPDAVFVSTVHKAKGLEFPVVFVADVEQNRFPGSRRKYAGLLPERVMAHATAQGRFTNTLSEQARLFYTAVTRAEAYLYVTGAENLPGGKQKRKKSKYALRLEDSGFSVDPDFSGESSERMPRQRRISEDNVPTSYTEIRYFLKCPQDYLFRYHYGFSPAIGEMFGFGQTVHASVGKLHEVFRNKAPSEDEAAEIAGSLFHLKHIPESRDPINRPGGYEKARDKAESMVRAYVGAYGEDFTREREVEARFEIPVERAVISGAIDLLVKEDEEGNIVDASVIDFKAMAGGDDPFAEDGPLEWTELSLQVQLYAKAAREVLDQAANTGAVHLLKDNQRVVVPVDDKAVESAVENVLWSVRRILAGEFPRRPSTKKCGGCDFRGICRQTAEQFATDEEPPEIHIPNEVRVRARAFRDLD